MTDEQRLALTASVIEEFRPHLQQDGGDIALVAIDGDRVRVHLSGACLHCGMVAQTLGAIRRRLLTVLDSPVLVVPAADHG